MLEAVSDHAAVAIARRHGEGDVVAKIQAYAVTTTA
jgi:hypothetical protein